MLHSDTIPVIILFLFIFSGLINNHNYLITASISKIYLSVFLSLSFVSLIITFFTSTNTYDFILGILYAIAFLLSSFLRNGISKKAFIGSRGDCCEISKVKNVKLIKNANNIQVIYNHHLGESYMYFHLDDYSKLICILRKLISDDKLNIDI